MRGGNYPWRSSCATRQPPPATNAGSHAFSSHFIPFLLQAAGVSAGYRVLDVATGTGLAAEAALALVGPAGQVTATDISPQMADRARERLKAAPNATVQIEDGQALGLPDGSFDAVICSLGLMFFPDPA